MSAPTTSLTGGELLAELALAASMTTMHMAMPNHWLIFSLAGRAQRWTLAKTLTVTALGALGHLASTLIAAVVLTVVGRAVLSEDALRTVTAAALVLFGAYYLRLYFSPARDRPCCEHEGLHETLRLKVDAGAAAGDVEEGGEYGERWGNGGGGGGGGTGGLRPTDRHDDHRDHHQNYGLPAGDARAGGRGLELSLILVPTLSPCVGSMPLLLQAAEASRSWGVLGLVVAVVGVTTLGMMVGLVSLGFVGSRVVAGAAGAGAVQRHEKLVVGLGFWVLAAVAVVLDTHHHHDHES